MSAMGLGGGTWSYAVKYAAFIHNIAYSDRLGASPYMLMHGCKPDASNHQSYGVECCMYCHEGTQSDKKLDPSCNQCICLGYAQNWKGYYVLNISHTQHVVMQSTNLMFTNIFPLSKSNQTELMTNSEDLPLSFMPNTMSVDTITKDSLPTVIGMYAGHLVIEVS